MINNHDEEEDLHFGLDSADVLLVEGRGRGCGLAARQELFRHLLQASGLKVQGFGFRV